MIVCIVTIACVGLSNSANAKSLDLWAWHALTNDPEFQVALISNHSAQELRPQALAARSCSHQ